MSLLPTNYQNEIINSAMSNRRQYRIIENNNGTVSFIDVTVYDREGSLFDADDVNAITTQINLNITDIESIQGVLQTGVVNGIKGSAESNFRVGQVTLSAANLNAYTKDEVENLIATVGGMHFKLVDELPTEDISYSTIYLVPSPNSRARNTKDEYIYLNTSHFTDVTDSCDIVEDYSSLPETGSGEIFYIIRDDEKVYVWDSENTEYVESTDYTASIVDVLPNEPSPSILYILSSDDTVNEWIVSNEWEQIGSTSVNLSNYYTKTEIDNGALITVSEFNELT